MSGRKFQDSYEGPLLSYKSSGINKISDEARKRHELLIQSSAGTYKTTWQAYAHEFTFFNSTDGPEVVEAMRSGATFDEIVTDFDIGPHYVNRRIVVVADRPDGFQKVTLMGTEIGPAIPQTWGLYEVNWDKVVGRFYLESAKPWTMPKPYGDMVAYANGISDWSWDFAPFLNHSSTGLKPFFFEQPGGIGPIIIGRMALASENLAFHLFPPSVALSLMKMNQPSFNCGANRSFLRMRNLSVLAAETRTLDLFLNAH